MVPSWVPDVPPDGLPEVDRPLDPDGPPADPPNLGAVATPTGGPVPIAPVGRFRPARTSLGKFASSGGTGHMRRGVGHYFRSGLGGAGTAGRRFGGTARTAGRLYGLLGGGGGAGADANARLNRDVLAGRSAREVIDAIVEAARPVDGTQDSEASRNSVNDALSELMDRYPDADLLSLSEEERLFVTERFVSKDVYHRFMLDIGSVIQDKAPSLSVALSRLKEAREYIRETVAAAFRSVAQAGQRLTAGRVSQLVQQALVDAFDVFAGYAE